MIKLNLFTILYLVIECKCVFFFLFQEKMLITDSLLFDLTIAVGTLLVAGFFYIKHKYGYWTRRGVTQLSPVFPFGNYGVALPKGFSLGARTNRFYNAFKKSGNKLGGK